MPDNENFGYLLSFIDFWSLIDPFMNCLSLMKFTQALLSFHEFSIGVLSNRDKLRSCWIKVRLKRTNAIEYYSCIISIISIVKLFVTGLLFHSGILILVQFLILNAQSQTELLSIQIGISWNFLFYFSFSCVFATLWRHVFPSHCLLGIIHSYSYSAEHVGLILYLIRPVERSTLMTSRKMYRLYSLLWLINSLNYI